MLPWVPMDGYCFIVLAFCSIFCYSSSNLAMLPLINSDCLLLKTARRDPKQPMIFLVSASHIYLVYSVDSSAQLAKRQILLFISSIFICNCRSTCSGLPFSCLRVSLMAASSLLICASLFFSSAALWRRSACSSSILLSYSFRELKYSLFKFSILCWKQTINDSWETVLASSLELCTFSLLGLFCNETNRPFIQSSGTGLFLSSSSCGGVVFCCLNWAVWQVRLSFLLEGTLVNSLGTCEAVEVYLAVELVREWVQEVICALEERREVSVDELLEATGEYILNIILYSLGFYRLIREETGIFGQKYHHTDRFSRLPELLLGTKETFGFLARYCAMFTAAYSFLISIWVAPKVLTAWLISLAAQASASDLIICAFFNSSSLKTINFCISASCCCTAFFSMALEYSGLKPRCMKLTSSTLTLNSCALANKLFLISLLMVSLDLSS